MNTPQGHPALYILLAILAVIGVCGCLLMVPRTNDPDNPVDFAAPNGNFDDEEGNCTADWLTCLIYAADAWGD